MLLLEFDGDAEDVVARVVEDRLDCGEVAFVEVASVEVASVEVASVEVASVEVASVEVASVEVAPIEVWLTVISAAMNYLDESICFSSNICLLWGVETILLTLVEGIAANPAAIKDCSLTAKGYPFPAQELLAMVAASLTAEDPHC